MVLVGAFLVVENNMYYISRAIYTKPSLTLQSRTTYTFLLWDSLPRNAFLPSSSSFTHHSTKTFWDESFEWRNIYLARTELGEICFLGLEWDTAQNSVGDINVLSYDGGYNVEHTFAIPLYSICIDTLMYAEECPGIYYYYSVSFLPRHSLKAL